MRELAQSRLRRNTQQSLRYLRLVFNDFFVLALVFIAGAVMFWYAQALKTMPAGRWYYRPLLLVILWLPFLTGRLVTLFEEADRQFLLPTDERLQSYFKPMIAYSMIMPTVLIVLLAGVLAPLALVKAGLPAWHYLLLVCGLVFLKYLQLSFDAASLYFNRKLSSWAVRLLILLVIANFCYNFWLGLILTVALTALIRYLPKGGHFDWQRAVELEQARKTRVYTGFAMFTDVSELKPAIRRRKGLDFLLGKSQNGLVYLYQRTLLRNPDYLNLLVRMTVFAVLVSWLLADWRWAAGLSALLVFLTAYQLLALGHSFDYNLAFRVSPLSLLPKSKPLAKVMGAALLIQSLVIAVSWLVVLGLSVWLKACGILLVADAVIILVYLPSKLKKEK